MSDLISREGLIDDLRSQYESVFVNARMKVEPSDFYIERRAAYDAAMVKAEIEAFFEYLRSRPTIEAEPVRHAQWLYRMYRETERATVDGEICCPECSSRFKRIKGTWFKYCPECGAKMAYLPKGD